MAAGPRGLMSQAALHILMALATGEMHGYGVKQRIEERTEGELSLGPGTLYEGIQRLERDGLVEEVAGDGGSGRRRVYRLTAAGRAEMEAELRRLDRLVTEARARRLLPEGG